MLYSRRISSTLSRTVCWPSAIHKAPHETRSLTEQKTTIEINRREVYNTSESCHYSCICYVPHLNTTKYILKVTNSYYRFQHFF